MTVRHIAERMSRNIVLRRRLPRSFRNLPIYVTPEASLRYWLPMPKVDPFLYRMAHELVGSGSVVWDIGANVGLFALCAASLAGPAGFVLAVEPDRRLANLIRRTFLRTANRRDIAPTAIEERGVSSKDGTSNWLIAKRSRAANYMEDAKGSSQANGYREIQSIKICTLDQLLARYPAPSIVKVDVEAHELEVLKGSKNLLANARPVIWSEVAPENTEQVFALLDSARYNLYPAATTSPRTLLKGRASFDTLAIPREKDTLAR